jgi:hypothetical protein
MKLMKLRFLALKRQNALQSDWAKCTSIRLRAARKSFYAFSALIYIYIYRFSQLLDIGKKSSKLNGDKMFISVLKRKCGR